ncbi:MAG TPA: hypothetical protein VNG12_23535, partial [Acidimicrobiales bacterium]|nr:hypothetical protein [Acidimicrobiales bacterium]
LSFCALKCVSRQYSNQWMVATGVVFGLLVTTKLSSIPLGLIIVVLALMASTWRHRISLLLYGTGSALFVSSWYLLQNWVRYGDPLARRASAAYLIRINGVGAPLGLPYVVRDPAHLIFVDVPYRILRTFWYQSGWASFVWSLTTSILITGAICAVLLGLIGQYYPKRELYVLGAISILAFASVWMVAFQTGSYTSRYALVGSAAMAALLALALRPWPLVLRWLLPAAGLLGCLVAIQHDVLSVHLA